MVIKTFTNIGLMSRRSAVAEQIDKDIQEGFDKPTLEAARTMFPTPEDNRAPDVKWLPANYRSGQGDNRRIVGEILSPKYQTTQADTSAAEEFTKAYQRLYDLPDNGTDEKKFCKVCFKNKMEKAERIAREGP